MVNINLKRLIFNLLNNKTNISQIDKKIYRYKRYFIRNILSVFNLTDLNTIKWNTKYYSDIFLSYDSFIGLILDTAASDEYLETIKWIYCNESIKVSADNTKNILIVAAMKGHLKVIKFLYEFGKDFNIYDTILCAIRSNQLNIIKWFFEETLESYSDDYLQEAQKYGDTEIVKYLKFGVWH